jgi:hypothetical protein
MGSDDRHRFRPLRTVSFVAALALLPAAPALANAPAGLEEAFDNTIVSTYDNGDQARLWLDRDGTYRGEGRRGDASSGHWSVKGEKLCFKQSHPLPIPFSFCTAMVTGGVGSAWKARSVFGEPLSVELAPGR